MTNDAATLAAALIRDVPDFPTPGILFKDIGPLIGDATALRAVIDHFAARHTDRIDAVAGIEAAQRAGMKTVGIGQPAVLTKADVVLANLNNLQIAELKNILFSE